MVSSPHPEGAIEELARIVGDPTADVRLRDDAANRVIERIRTFMHGFVARQPEARLHRDELLSHVYTRLLEGKYKSNVPFVSWCTSVLNNKFRDIRRSAWSKARPLEEREPTWDDAEDIKHAAEFVIGMEEAEIIASAFVNPTHRVVIMCRSLLYRRLPPSVWAEWVMQANLTMPFPEECFDDDEFAAKQNGYLASALGASPNNIRKIWERGLPGLRSMAFLRRLRP